MLLLSYIFFVIGSTGPYQPLGRFPAMPQPYNTLVQQQGHQRVCDIQAYMTCKADVDRCEAQCVSVDSEGCKSCLGRDKHVQCKACFKEKKEMEMRGLGMLIMHVLHTAQACRILDRPL